MTKSYHLKTQHSSPITLNSLILRKFDIRILMSYNTIQVKISELVWEDWHIEHIAARHSVEPMEVEEACFEDENARVLRGKGGREEKLYYVLGKTLKGRYLFIVVKRLGKCKAKVITAREMNASENRRYNIL